MITSREVVTGLYAAWRLFLRDRAAVRSFDDSPAGVVKSFFCAVIVLPVYALIALLVPGDAARDDMFRLVAVDLIAYVIDWTAWPLAMAFLAPLLDRDDDYCRYIVAHNWSAAPQYLLFLIVLVMFSAGLVSRPIFELLGFAVFVVILLYQLFILRVALRVGLPVAVALLFAVTALSLFISLLQGSLMV